MAIKTGLCIVAKLSLWNKEIDLGADVFKMALYTSAATLNSSTTVYAATNEVSGSGYSAGGVALTNVAPVASSEDILITFADPVTFTATLTGVRGALIYNTTFANQAFYVWDFGSDIASVGGVLRVRMPDVAAGTGLIIHR